jgi:uncharacterized protein (TIGR02145 family)
MVNNKFSYFLILVTLFFFCCSKEEKPPATLTDIEGNLYNTVKIGDQVWMAENLKTKRYNDGSEIPLVTDASTWGNLSSPGYSWYDNDETTYKDSYGALYNGYAVSTGKLCPAGWHVPDRFEWQELRTFSGDSISGGGKLKEAGTSHWHSPNEGADNSTGFTAMPAGLRYFEGTFSSVSYFTSFWSGTVIGNNDAWYMSLYYDDARIIMNHRSAKHGFSVRCLRD